MAEIVETDGSGRIVIPKSVRQELGIKEKTKFLLSTRGRSQLLLQKLDVNEIAKRLEEELRGTDVDAVVKSVRKEIQRKIRAKYPDIFA